jgi:dienelactone hydrolase
MTGTPRRTIGGAFCVLLVTLIALPRAHIAAQAAEIVVARDVKIGMRLGAPLRARVFRPAGAAPRTAVLSLEADTTDAREARARALAAAGFAVVIAVPRGGDDRHVGRDGYDAIEWINDQPWSDRRVVMSGTGEGANAAWNTAREHPPHLSAIVSRAPARPLGWTSQELERVAISTLSIAGSAGDAQGFAVETHEAYVKAPHGGGAPIAYLLIGSLPAAGLEQLEREWVAWAAGRGPLSPLLRKRVNYLAADGTWRAADSLEGIGARPTSFPLHANAGPRAAPGGFLGGAARDDEPADTVADGEKSYETPLDAPLELAGQPAVTLWLAHEPPPAPLSAHRVRIVSLDEVLADGRVLPLGSSGGYRKGSDTTAAASGEDRWEFTSFPWIARTLAAGSRLRLTVNGAATVIHHDVERYSRVILPAVRRPL